MKNVSIFLLFLFVAVCSAARFPFQRRGNSHCADCSGLFQNCFCSDLDDCAYYGCDDVGACSYATCDNTPAKRRLPEALKREPNDCPDCAGFAAGCPCDAYDICQSEGCSSTGECTASNCEPSKKRTLAGYLPKREPNDCPDCAGFAAGCPCDAHTLCESEGCSSTGECTASNCEPSNKRTLAGYLLKREPNDCPDCAGFAAGCPCDAYTICQSEGCSSTGECTASNCESAKKRTLAGYLLKRKPAVCHDLDCPGLGSDCSCDDISYCTSQGCSSGACTSSTCAKKKRTIASYFLKRGDEICDDCPGFGPGCPCSDALLCIESCGTAGECTSGNCS